MIKKHQHFFIPPTELINAINQRLVVSFSYDGLPRTVHPYIYGVLENGRVVLSGVQTAGESKSHEIPAWKTFSLAKIQHLVITAEKFIPNNPLYNPRDPQFEQIFTQV